MVFPVILSVHLVNVDLLKSMQVKEMKCLLITNSLNLDKKYFQHEKCFRKKNMVSTFIAKESKTWNRSHMLLVGTVVPLTLFSVAVIMIHICEVFPLVPVCINNYC